MSFDTDLQAMLQENETRLAASERATMTAHAMREMSSDYPRRIVRDFAGDGVSAYALVDSTTAAPAESGILNDDWVANLSQILRVQHYPVDKWENLDPEEWRQDQDKYGTTTEEWIESLVLSEAIDSSVTLRVQFTVAWADPDTELAGRLYTAALELAAAYAHSAIAAEYAEMTDATLDADSVDQGNLSGRHMDLHDLHRKNYRKLMGLQQDDGKGSGASAPPASLQKDLVDYAPSYGGVSLRRGYNR